MFSKMWKLLSQGIYKFSWEVCTCIGCNVSWLVSIYCRFGLACCPHLQDSPRKVGCRGIVDFEKGKATNEALGSDPLRAAELSVIFYLFSYRKIIMYTGLCSNIGIANGAIFVSY
jgi:hypothetical protein